MFVFALLLFISPPVTREVRAAPLPCASWYFGPSSYCRHHAWPPIADAWGTRQAERLAAATLSLRRVGGFCSCLPPLPYFRSSLSPLCETRRT